MDFVVEQALGPEIHPVVLNDMIILFSRDLAKEEVLWVFYMDFQSKIIKIMNKIELGVDFKILDIWVNKSDNIEIVYK